MKKYETTTDFERAVKIEALVLRNFLADIDCAARALEELATDPDRSDEAIAKAIAMRMARHV